MPKGVETVVDGGFATIDFIDVSQRGAGLNRLLEIGGPESIETITRQGPRRKYRVPEGNAREAGLLDKASTKDVTPARGDTGFAGDLAAAHEQQAAEGNRPVLPTSGGNTYVGTSTAEEVNAAGGSPATTVKGGEGVGGLTSTPTHDEVVAHVAEQRSVPEYVPAHEPQAQTLNQGLRNDPGDPRWGQIEAPKSTGPNYDDGKPDKDWRRGDLNAYAAKLGINNPEGAPNKEVLLEAIRKADKS